MMNDYFITKEDLDVDREHMWNAIAKCLSDLRNEFLLILDAMGYESRPAKEIKKGDKMSERKIKELIGQLWILGEKLNNEEILDIAKGLEEYVEKASSNLKEFNEELKDLLGRVKALEEKRE